MSSTDICSIEELPAVLPEGLGSSDAKVLTRERSGNRRCDTYTNGLQVDEVPIIVLVPNIDMTLPVMDAKANLDDAMPFSTDDMESFTEDDHQNNVY